MRVIGGSRRGLRLASVPGLTTRPTADMVKEALFNIVANRIEGAVVLDLFAGSGALGIEALSRGAERAVFVEHDRKAIDVIRKNLERTQLQDRARIVTGDVFKTLATPQRLEDTFDFVFADPPYSQNLAGAVLAALSDGRKLSEGGLIVVEHDRREELSAVWENIAAIRAARYGDTVLTFYRGGL